MRIWTLFVFAGLLAACSGHTIYRFEVDIRSFIPEEKGKDSLEMPPFGEVQKVLLPAPEGQQVDLPEDATKVLVDGRIEATLQVTNSTSGSLTASFEVRVGPEEDNNLFDGQNKDTRWGGDEINLEPEPGKKTGSISLDLSLDPSNPEVYNLVKSGRFRIGLKIEFSGGGGEVQYELTEAKLALALKSFNLIPNP